MISKAFCVRVPAHELAAVESLLAQFPGVSPALLIRALLLASGRIGVANALAKHAAGSASYEAVKGFPGHYDSRE